jgi:hypothetical protein
VKTTFLFLGILISSFAFTQTSDNPYDLQYEESDGLRRVRYRGQYGYIDRKGNEVIPLKYASATDFKDGLAKVSLDKKKYGYINTQGAVVIPLEYESFFDGFIQGNTPAQKNGRWGMISDKGKLVIPHEYDLVLYPSEGMVCVGKKVGDDLRYGFVNMQGQLVIPCKYEMTDAFSEGLVAAQLNNQFGFLNASGETIIPFQFESARRFREGMAMVKVKGKWGFIDKSGKIVIQPEYNKVKPFEGGEAEVLKGTEAYFINKKGERLKNGKWLLIFTKGINYGEQFWFRGRKWSDELKKKYDEGFRYTDVQWNRYEEELFITMSKTTTHWQSNFFHNFEFSKMWDKVLEHYKDNRALTQLSFNKGKWTFMFTPLLTGKKEVAVNAEDFPIQNIRKHWKDGKYITKMAYGDRWVIVMREENYSDQALRAYENNRWDEEDMQANFKKGFFITDVVKLPDGYVVVYTKGTPIKEQLLVWDEELPLRDIKGYWSKGWASYRTIFIPRETTLDVDE